MNENDLIKFLENFEIERYKIKDFLKNKKIIEIDTLQPSKFSKELGPRISKKKSLKNIFLVDKKLKLRKNQKQIGDILFINLFRLVISKFLLNFITKNSKNIIEIKNEKDALNFTYSKKLLIGSIINLKDNSENTIFDRKSKISQKTNSFKFHLNKNYIVLFQKNILGYCKFIKKEGDFYFENSFNIGNYLKEK